LNDQLLLVLLALYFAFAQSGGVGGAIPSVSSSSGLCRVFSIFESGASDYESVASFVFSSVARYFGLAQQTSFLVPEPSYE